MEARLKHDVLSEAAAFDGAILVSEENDDMQVKRREREREVVVVQCG
jgi:hypothetical protein